MRSFLAHGVLLCTFIGIAGSVNADPYLMNDSSAASSEGISVNAQSFIDVSADSPYADAINYLHSQGIVNGYSDGTFRPDARINRAEFTKIVVDTLDGGDMEKLGGAASYCSGLLGTGIPFTDVAYHDWFVVDVCLAYKTGMIAGYPDNTFRPAANINFAEAAKILVTAHNLNTDVKLPLYPNVWYEAYVRALAANNGIPTSIKSFDQPITRGEMAEMIYRLTANIMNKPSQTYDDLAHPASTATSPSSAIVITDSTGTTVLSSVTVYSDGSGKEFNKGNADIPSSSNTFPPGTIHYDVLLKALYAYSSMSLVGGICATPGSYAETITYAGQTSRDVNCMGTDANAMNLMDALTTVMKDIFCSDSPNIGMNYSDCPTSVIPHMDSGITGSVTPVLNTASSLLVTAFTSLYITKQDGSDVHMLSPDANGQFSVSLAPGQYTLFSFLPFTEHNGVGSPDTQTKMLPFTVSPHTFVHVALQFVVNAASSSSTAYTFPTSQQSLPAARDAQRRSDVNTILNAVYQYAIDHNNNIPPGIPTGTPKEICQGDLTGSACIGAPMNGVDLSELVGTYLPTVPQDPLITTSGGGTKYYIVRKANDRITVSADGEDPAGTLNIAASR